MKPASISIFIAALIALTSLSCRQQARWARPDPTNVIIVMVDTLRADHMSTYGYERETTPFISKFASQAVVFEHARSQASCTFPSVNSLLTSRNPAIFIRQGKGRLGIPDAYPSIAEILKEHGYRTIAVSASPRKSSGLGAHSVRPQPPFARNLELLKVVTRTEGPPQGRNCRRQSCRRLLSRQWWPAVCSAARSTAPCIPSGYC